MARPTKYNKDILEKANTYLTEWVKQGDMIPSVEALAGYLDVSRKTLYNWGDSHSEFLHILEEVNRLQAKTLINNGLSGDFNSAITKLVLGKHGYSDKQDQQITGAGGGAQEHKWTVEFINASKDSAPSKS